MGKKYLLLRNNKQSGPFTIEELGAHGLKKSDLIWVEGESVGWRSPDEITSIQSGLSPVAEPASKPSALPSNDQRVLGRHIFVRMPGSGPASVSTNMIAKLPAEPDLSAAEKLERKAELLREKALNYQSAEKFGAQGLDTKYSRSLDDIKEEYSAWMQKQNGRSVRQKESYPEKDPTGWILRAAIVLGVAALAGIGYMVISDRKKPVYVLSSVQKIPAAKTEAFVATKAVTEFTEPEKVKPETALPSKTYPVSHRIEKPGTESIRPAQKISRPTVVSQPSTQKTRPAVAAQEVIAERPSVKNSVTASGYSESPGSGTWTVVVSNNSLEELKMVAVDVHFAKNNARKSSKTVYLNNIAAQSSASATVQLPKHAGSVTYRIGLISSQKGGIYFARN